VELWFDNASGISDGLMVYEKTPHPRNDKVLISIKYMILNLKIL